MHTFEAFEAGLSTAAASETIAGAEWLAAQCPPCITLALEGDLGSGKTTFVGGLAAAWGIAEPITSPTYNLCALYRGTRRLVHIDAYRLDPDGSARDALMLDDFLEAPWCLAVEWPERAPDLLLEPVWRIQFALTPTLEHRIRLIRS